MSKPFLERLKAYYTRVGEALRGEATLASVFPNPADVGTKREQIYAAFLNAHLPLNCNTFLGGFVFNLDGDESNQIDVIVACDSSLQFNWRAETGHEKSFTCIEGCLAVASIKSILNTAELYDALENIASIPLQRTLGDRVNPMINIPSYHDWPFKIVYAHQGISLDSLLDSLRKYDKDVNLWRTPNLIHVAGKGFIVRTPSSGLAKRSGERIVGNTYYANEEPSDVWALNCAVLNIHRHALASRHINYEYDDLFDSLPFEELDEDE